MRNKKALIILVVSLLSPLTCSASDELIIDVTEWWEALEGVTGNGFVRDDSTNTISLNSDNEEFTSDVAKWWEDAGPIHIENNSERNITIDGEISLEGESLKLELTKGLLISGNNITVKNVSVRNIDPSLKGSEVRKIDRFQGAASFEEGPLHACLSVEGENITLDDVEVDGCYYHGIYIDGENNDAPNATIKNSVVSRTNIIARGYTPHDGNKSVGSAIKMSKAVGSKVTGNLVINNYGEGINATRSSGITISENVTVDNLSANIYSDNSKTVTIDSNYSYCTTHAVFHPKTNRETTGIAVAEECYEDESEACYGEGSQPSKDIDITNNIVSGCLRGIAYQAHDYETNDPTKINAPITLGLKDATISHNTVFDNYVNAVYFKAVVVDDNEPPHVTDQTGNVEIINNIFGVSKCTEGRPCTHLHSNAHDPDTTHPSGTEHPDADHLVDIHNHPCTGYPCKKIPHEHNRYLAAFTDPKGQLNNDGSNSIVSTSHNLWVNGILHGEDYTYGEASERLEGSDKVSEFSTTTYSFSGEPEAFGTLEPPGTTDLNKIKGSSLSDESNTSYGISGEDTFDDHMISLLNKLPMDVACYIYDRDPSDSIVEFYNANLNVVPLSEGTCSDVKEFE